MPQEIRDVGVDFGRVSGIPEFCTDLSLYNKHWVLAWAGMSLVFVNMFDFLPP